MSSNAVTNAYIDLATYDDIERHIYGGADALVQFVRCIQKSNWFSQIPVQLRIQGGTADFNRKFSADVSRAGDYLLYVWVRLTVPEITLSTVANRNCGWTRNFMHNLIKDANITFNEINVHEFDNYWLDYLSQHTLPGSKSVGYDNMIGNDYNFYWDPNNIKTNIPSLTLNLPLPFFFGKRPADKNFGNALPTGQLPFNDIRINLEFRDWTELFVISDTSTPDNITPTLSLIDESSVSLGSSVQVWANYAVVTTQERDLMGVCPRDMLIEQTQKINASAFVPASGASTNYDVRLSHAVKALFWNARNKTTANLWSNYTTGPTTDAATNPVPDLSTANYFTGFYGGYDPIATTSVVYENSNRLSEMPSDYFSLVQQFYHWTRIPDETGYHSYSYALVPEDSDPTGSTNFGKLANASLRIAASTAGIRSIAAASNATYNGVSWETNGATYDMVIRALSWNIVRIFGGTLGFPVL